ncbi:MAG: hypothetical protein ACXABO_00670 [Promethearchaeota archaeon]
MRKKAQDIDEMKFCKDCKMNVFPTRPKFNIKIFGICVIIMLVVFTSITILTASLFMGFLLFIFIMWGFIIINPYLIFYGIKKKQYCPKCYQELVEKNLTYEPFGETVSEVYNRITPATKSRLKFYCTNCGKSLNEQTRFCSSCGKKFDILG